MAKPASRGGIVGRAVLLLALTTSSPAVPSHAQQPERPSGGTWAVVDDAGADLWFHGLALVGVRGLSPLPLYSADYAEQIRAAKQAAGAYPTPLDDAIVRFRMAFERDSTLELLHFVPLYFGRVEPEALLDELDAVTRGRRPRGFGAGVVADVLASRQQREVLADFVRALRDEWRLFLREYRSAQAPERTRRLNEVTPAWQRLVPLLRPFLAARRLDGGVLLISPALGPEGRVVRGDAVARLGSTIAVWSPPGSAGRHAALFGAVREACFPLVSEMVERLRLGGGERVAAERVSSRGAVWCGAQLIARHAPELLPEYQRVYLGAAGDPGAPFDRVFHVPTELRDSIQPQVAR